MNELIEKKQTELDIYDPKKMEALWQYCTNVASSNLIPAHYQNKPANVMIAFQRAQYINTDICFFMEQTYIVGGKLGIQGKFIISLINSSGKLKNNLNWEFKRNQKGEIISCTCYGITKKDERIEYTLTWEEVTLNMWNQSKIIQNGPMAGKKLPSKWDTMRQKMFMYRTASWLVDVYFPELLGGMSSVESLEDEKIVEAAEFDVVDSSPLSKKDENEELKKALIIRLKDDVPQNDEESLISFMIEKGYIAIGFHSFENDLKVTQAKKLMKNYDNFMNEFKIFVNLKSKFLNFLGDKKIDFIDFNRFLIKNKNKDVGSIHEISYKELKVIYPILNQLISDFAMDLEK